MVDRKRRRDTRQRRVILEELKKVSWHPTAAELYDVARQRLPKISLGTVYRNLELLARDGTIQKLETSGGESRFDGNLDRHWHVRCARCGRLDDVSEVPLDLEGTKVENLSGYEILGYRLEFNGICPECKRSPTSDESGAPPRRAD